MNYCTDYTLPDKYRKKIETLSKRGIISLLKNHSWLQTIWQYLNNNTDIVSNIVLHSIQIDNELRFNILAELCVFLKKTPDLVVMDTVNKLESIVSHQEHGTRITSEHRYFIRKHFELDQSGINAIAQFETYIRELGILSEEGLLLLNPYTSILNLNEIYIQAKYKYTVSYTYKGRKYNNITLYTAKQMSTSSTKDMLYLRQLAVYVCLYPYLLAYENLDSTGSRPKAITLYLINFPKRFMQAKGKDPLIYTSSEINTGVCDMVNIAVTRSEEALKTVLHELFHFYEMDFKHTYISHERQLSAQYNINNKLDSLNLFEAYTECITSIINILGWMYFSLPSTTAKYDKQPDYELNKSVLCDMFCNQVIYTTYKLAKIQKLNKCSRFMDSECQLNQTTNVASYFLFKLFLYFDLATLSNTCITRETPKFIDTKSSIAQFMSIITKGAENKLLGAIINYLLETVDFDKITSARMTCVN